jgi:iron complex transport system ATP-binding protein
MITSNQQTAAYDLIQANTPPLEARAVGYTIAGRHLVDRVSLALRPGELLALAGPNGAGKTTLLRMLAGDLAPTRGEVLLDGQPLAQLSARDQALRRAVLRQQLNVAFPFSAFEVVLMGRHPHIDRRGETLDDLRIAREALARVDAVALAARSFPTLSGGEQARIMLAKTLAQAAPILLLDEPIAALDPRHQHAALRLAREVALAGGAVLAVLHDLTLAATYADRIGLLHDGHLVALAAPWEALRGDLLESVYGVPMLVQRHPTLGTPLVLVVPDR